MKCDKKKKYESEEIAKQRIDFEFKKFGDKKYSYFCNDCKFWHLTSWDNNKLATIKKIHMKNRIEQLAEHWERKFGIEK